MAAQTDKITTGVDKLVQLISEKKRVSMDQAAQILSLPKVLIEEWAEFLNEKKVIDIEYKFSTPYLVYKELSQEDMELRARQFNVKNENFSRKITSLLEYLDQQGEGVKQLKNEFEAITRELEPKAGQIRGEIDSLARYEALKRSITSQILPRQAVTTEKKKKVARHMLAKKKLLEGILKRISVEGGRLKREEVMSRLLRKDESRLKSELRAIIGRAQQVQKKIEDEDYALDAEVNRVAKLERLASRAKREIRKEEALVSPLMAEYKQHDDKVIELKRQLLKKLAAASKNSGVKPAEVRMLREKFNTLFEKKSSAEKLLNHVASDLDGLRKDLRDLSAEAAVMRISSDKKRPGSRHLKEFEQKLNAVAEKKEKFQGEVHRLVSVLKKM